MFNASTLSQNRWRRYNDTSVAQDIFDGIVEQAIAHGLVDGTVLYTDSTHLKANADKHRVDRERLGMITDTHTTPEACMTASPI